MFNKTIEYKNWVFKSDLEYQFCLYLEQLQENGFIKEFSYETIKLDISPSVYKPYLTQLKSKVKEDKEFLMRENTYQPDFVVTWEECSKNLFYLDREVPITCKVSDIPFRLAFHTNTNLTSFLESKPIFEGNLNSSKEFTIIQKWLYQDKGVFVQKIKPENLFKQTFVPDKLIASNVYQKQSKFGTKGSSKFRYVPKTLQEYLKYRGYGEIN
jgi:hypothetical protein